MKKGETTKACPGCGEEGIRDANAVCMHCKQLLQEAKAARARQEQETEYQVYAVPETFPWYHAPAQNTTQQELRRIEEQLRVLMQTLTYAIGIPAVGTKAYHPERAKLFTFPKGRQLHYSFNDSQLLLKPETARVLDELDTTLQMVIVASYEEGKRDGAHLLGQLASGEITVADFNLRVDV